MDFSNNAAQVISEILNDPQFSASPLGHAEAEPILFTQDEDFLAIAHEWPGAGRDLAGLAYAHQHRITIGQAVGDLELIAVAHDPEEMRNRVLYLPFPRARRGLPSAVYFGETSAAESSRTR